MKKFLFLFVFVVLVGCTSNTSKVARTDKMDVPGVVFFDYNGTLYDDKKIFDEGCEKYCKWKTKQQAEQFAKASANKKKELIVKLLGSDVLKQVYSHFATSKFAKVQGAEDVLIELTKQKIKTYVLSRSDGTKLRKWLADGNLLHYFNDVYGKNDFGDLQKPNKDFADKIKEVVRLKNQKCWMIGDSEQDIVMAKNLGCKSVIVDNFEEINQNYGNLIDENVVFMKYSKILNLIKKINIIIDNKNEFLCINMLTC